MLLFGLLYLKISRQPTYFSFATGNIFITIFVEKPEVHERWHKISFRWIECEWRWRWNNVFASKCYSIWSWCIGIKEDDEISAIISLLSKKVTRSSIIKTEEFHTVVARTNNSACNSFLFTFVVLIDAQASPVPTKREECNKYMINEKIAPDSSLCPFYLCFLVVTWWASKKSVPTNSCTAGVE